MESTPEAIGGEQRRFALALAAAVLVGAWLRGTELASQILIADELHVLYAVVSLPLAEIARTWVYERADYGVPLGLLFRSLLDHGVALSELALRLPMLASGILVVGALPWALRRRIGARAALLLGWLLALSPLLVYYSRVVRSYMPVVLLANGAIVAFLRFRDARSPSWGALYVLLASAAIYFHLVAAPFVLAPLLFLLLEAAVSRGRSLRLADALLPLGIAAVVALLLLPARESIGWVVEHRRASRDELAGMLGPLGELLAGAVPVPLALVFYGLAVAGFVRLGRRDARLTAVLVTCLCTQLVALIALSPERLANPRVAARYALVALPVLLVGVAIGLAAPWTRSRRTLVAIAERAGPVLFVVALAIAGPLARGPWRTPSFGNWRFFEKPGVAPLMPGEAMPAFYRELAGRPAGPLLEIPWHHVLFASALPLYQRYHGREVLVAYADAYPPSDARLALRNAVRPVPEAFLRSRARHLVLHLHPEQEEQLAGPLPGSIEWPRRQTKRAQAAHRAWVARLLGELSRDWGEPDYRDDGIAAWDLELLRKQAGAAR